MFSELATSTTRRAESSLSERMAGFSRPAAPMEGNNPEKSLKVSFVVANECQSIEVLKGARQVSLAAFVQNVCSHRHYPRRARANLYSTAATLKLAGPHFKLSVQFTGVGML